jgi:hypothetical protein
MQKPGPKPTSFKDCITRSGVRSLSSAPVTSSNAGVPDGVSGELLIDSDATKVDSWLVPATMYWLHICKTKHRFLRVCKGIDNMSFAKPFQEDRERL